MLDGQYGRIIVDIGQVHCNASFINPCRTISRLHDKRVALGLRIKVNS